MKAKLTFGKKEKLKSRKAFEELFSNSRTMLSHPIRFVYRVKPKEDYKIRVGVSVSKKKFKHAVDRNLLKRRIKEAYRLNKLIIQEIDLSIDLVIIYTTSKLEKYKAIEDSTIQLLQKLDDELQKVNKG